MDQGRQLGVTVDGELTLAHEFARHDHSSELATMSDECRASLERAGWTPDSTN
jgi:hypothetical protein